MTLGHKLRRITIRIFRCSIYYDGHTVQIREKNAHLIQWYNYNHDVQSGYNP